MRLTITRKHTGKMAGMTSLNTHVLNNPFCQRQVKANIICSQCYAKAIVHQYSDCDFKSWIDNGKLLSERLLKYSEIPNFRNKEVMRFHSFGELFNEIHLRNFIRIARNNSGIMFALWSKRADLIRDCKEPVPFNMILVYSTPRINGKARLPKGYHKVFTVFNAKYAMKNSIDINCSAKCIDCLLCYSRETTDTINEVLKSEAHFYGEGH
jgi:hypothetical protein